MKIIDEKGRLFGKINIIDFLVLVFLLSLTSILYYGHKIFLKKPPALVQEEISRDFIDIEERFDFINLNPYVLKLIAVGDKEADANGQVVAEIIKMEEPKPQVYKFDVQGGQKLLIESFELNHMLAVLRLKAERRGDILYYKDKQISLNSPVTFITPKYMVEAILKPVNYRLEAGDLDKIVDRDRRINLLENEVALIRSYLSSIISSYDMIRMRVQDVRNEWDARRNHIDHWEAIKKYFLFKNEENYW